MILNQEPKLILTPLCVAYSVLISIAVNLLIMKKMGFKKTIKNKALYSKLLSSKKKKLREERVQRALSLTNLIQRIQEMRKKKNRNDGNNLFSMQ